MPFDTINFWNRAKTGATEFINPSLNLQENMLEWKIISFYDFISWKATKTSLIFISLKYIWILTTLNEPILQWHNYDSLTM